MSWFRRCNTSASTQRVRSACSRSRATCSTLALHGHKHYATARMLEGMSEGHGDVLLVSAASAGLAQRWHDLSASDSARLWPSFNVIVLQGDELAIDTLSFAWKEEGSAKR